MNINIIGAYRISALEPIFMPLTLTGLAIDLIGACGLTRLMSSLLFGVSADDCDALRVSPAQEA
jgi:hypothetical protein